MRYGLSYRDVEELLAERGIVVDHVTVHGWVQRFIPMFIDAARPCRHSAGDRWFVDETYVKVGGRWCYLYRAVDQFGQVIDVYLSARRDARAARPFFDSAIAVTRTEPVEIVTDRAHPYLRVIEDRVPAVWHHVERYANHPVECDHGRLKARLGPMRGLNANAALGWLWPGTHSCRTCAEATTSSEWTCRRINASSQRSPNLLASSEKTKVPASTRPRGTTTQQ